MAKTLRDLNWSMGALNLALGFLSGLAIVLSNEMSLKKSALTIGLCITTSLIGWLTDAKKRLGGR